jgi:hypothetical protein
MNTTDHQAPGPYSGPGWRLCPTAAHHAQRRRAGYPPILSLFKSVVVTLTYLRRNHVQQELAEYYGVSQSTISRAITAITPELARLMHPFTPTAEDLPSDEQLIVDGTLVSCWSWDDHPSSTQANTTRPA